MTLQPFVPTGLAQQAHLQRLSIMQQRVQALFRQASDSAHRDGVLTAAFEELISALEVLHSGEHEHRTQLEAWLNEKAALEAEVDRYRQLFVCAPIGYFVTSVDGTIRMVNELAMQLFGSSGKGLIGRSLSMFLPSGQRRTFRADVAQVVQSAQTREWTLTMQSLDETPFDAVISVTPNYSANGRVLALWWLVRLLDK